MKADNEIDRAREILTVKNKVKYLTDGPTDEGTKVIVLRRAEHYSHYIPCVATIRHVTKTGRIAVDLWESRSEQTIVSRKAVLWPPVPAP